VLTSSPTASSTLASAPCSSKTAGAHFVTVSAWYTLTPGYPLPIEPGGVPSSRHYHHGELAGSEAVHHSAPETPCKLVDVALGGLVAERRPQNIVGIVGLLWRGQHQRQRLSDVSSQAVAPARGVDAARHVPAERCRRHRAHIAGELPSKAPTCIGWPGSAIAIRARGPLSSISVQWCEARARAPESRSSPDTTPGVRCSTISAELVSQVELLID